MEENIVREKVARPALSGMDTLGAEQRKPFFYGSINGLV